MAGNDFLGQPEFTADGTDLVLEQQSQRFNEGELQIRREATDVVMTLDVRRSTAAARLDDIGVERALHQELDVPPIGIGAGILVGQ